MLPKRNKRPQETDGKSWGGSVSEQLADTAPQNPWERIHSRACSANHPATRTAIAPRTSTTKKPPRPSCPGSDIDLTLKGSLDYPELIKLETELDDLLLPWKIDLSLYEQIDNPALIDRIGKSLYQRTSD
jgi:predicted nucleotidyltransferase